MRALLVDKLLRKYYGKYYAFESGPQVRKPFSLVMWNDAKKMLSTNPVVAARTLRTHKIYSRTLIDFTIKLSQVIIVCVTSMQIPTGFDVQQIVSSFIGAFAVLAAFHMTEIS